VQGCVALIVGFVDYRAAAIAQTQKSGDVAGFISVEMPVFVLNHVRVIDGTGAAPKEDQAMVVANGKIQSIGPAASAQSLREHNSWIAPATRSFPAL